MRVQKIRLTGFKSFADETVIELQDGITAIVGPNGCGKSNILDAVRWVLGEKSGKALRGQSMEDVIFLGSEHRKQAGMSEVEIYFDNRDRSLGKDQDEVVIGRRLYLNSASEYYLNGQRTTRRDIENVLMDTGIGKTAYSIMEQGRISEILKSSPENRRELLDEAAGISRFKKEREETLRRLHDTEQNILRLNDILKGKESEINNLERQAKKTRQYIQLKEKMDTHDRQLRYLRLKDMRSKDADCNAKLNALFKERDQMMDQVKQAEKAIDDFEIQVQTQLDEMQRLDRAFHQDQSRLESMRLGISRIDQERTAMSEKLELEKKRFGEELQNHKNLDVRYQESLQLELNLQTDIESRKASHAKLEESMQELRKQIRLAIEKEKTNLQTIQNGEVRQAALLEDLKNVTRDLILELEQRKKELQKREGYRRELKESIVTKLNASADHINEATALLESGKIDPALALMRTIELEKAIDDFSRYEYIEEEFRSLFFDRSGLLARKEDLDAQMSAIQKERTTLQQEIAALTAQNKLLEKQLEDKKNQALDLSMDIREIHTRKESSEEARQSLAKQLETTIKREEFHRQQVETIEREFQTRLNEQKELRSAVAESENRTREQSGSIDKLKKQIEKTRLQITRLKATAHKERQRFEHLLPRISEQDRQAESIRLQIRTIEEDLYNDYQMSPGELAESCQNKRLQLVREQELFDQLQQSIRDLGAFNALAIEELERARESYDELQSQRLDIEKAQKNILALLKEINEKSRELFIDTFERIQVNFSEIFQTLFGGGNARLSLDNPEDPLHSGVEIMVQPAGKKNSSLGLLSGGEQSMTAIALMFAIYLVRPSPFCFLDEIDAPLDDTNVGRFLRMLGRFTPRTQFLVISHNKLTMAQAQAIFGVTQEEAGVSKLISVHLSQLENRNAV
ncbi:MAG: AAA family ATPase [Leptospiraceae bacterium]|nr:AAA family ATPase [Leptospiraceae bacterium]